MKVIENRIKKREYVKLIENTVNHCLYLFDYAKKPYLIETCLPDRTLMCFSYSENRNDCAIYYDYQKFTKLYRSYDRKDQIYQVIFTTAHEMRHYYQFRQIRADKTVESPKVIKKWKDCDGKDLQTEQEYYDSDKEIDAFTFAYIYLAEEYGVILNNIGIPKNYRAILKKCSRQNYGKIHPVFKNKYKKLLY